MIRNRHHQRIDKILANLRNGERRPPPFIRSPQYGGPGGHHGDLHKQYLYQLLDDHADEKTAAIRRAHEAEKEDMRQELLEKDRQIAGWKRRVEDRQPSDLRPSGAWSEPEVGR